MCDHLLLVLVGILLIMGNAERIHVVISRYQERVDDLDWLTKWPHTIYNRGDLYDSNLTTVISLENVGRESFIYLSHIVKNYHQLAEINVFSQVTQSIPRYTTESFRKDVEGLAKGTKSFHPENDGFAFCIPLCKSSLDRKQMTELEKRFGREESQILKTGYKDYLNFTSPNPRFSATGCFFVTREVILRNSQQYYINLARLVGSESNPVAGHFLERAWPEVFHSGCSSQKRFNCLLDLNKTC